MGFLKNQNPKMFCKIGITTAITTTPSTHLMIVISLSNFASSLLMSSLVASCSADRASAAAFALSFYTNTNKSLIDFANHYARSSFTKRIIFSLVVNIFFIKTQRQKIKIFSLWVFS